MKKHCERCLDECHLPKHERMGGIHYTAHRMEVIGLVWRCVEGHEKARDGAEEMRNAGVRPML